MASEAEVSGQLRRIIERQSEPNRAHQGFREQTALAAHGRHRRRRRHGNLTCVFSSEGCSICG